jgi:hypothetical protein
MRLLLALALASLSLVVAPAATYAQCGVNAYSHHARQPQLRSWPYNQYCPPGQVSSSINSGPASSTLIPGQLYAGGPAYGPGSAYAGFGLTPYGAGYGWSPTTSYGYSTPSTSYGYAPPSASYTPAVHVPERGRVAPVTYEYPFIPSADWVPGPQGAAPPLEWYGPQIGVPPGYGSVGEAQP